MNKNIYTETLRKVVDKSEYKNGFHFVGTSAYIAFANGNRARLNCYDKEISVSIISKTDGIIDKLSFPYANYFSAKQCSPNAPKWYPFIDGTTWYFGKMYAHVLPNTQDYMELANGIDEYISMFR